ncbi:hypothetical protein HDU97_006294 [Phlyctochytrium planicorne]|nr:hypothetical protein HDU97_006294 [Phlyctochytrium planicorne]
MGQTAKPDEVFSAWVLSGYTGLNGIGGILPSPQHRWNPSLRIENNSPKLLLELKDLGNTPAWTIKGFGLGFQRNVDVAQDRHASSASGGTGAPPVAMILGIALLSLTVGMVVMLIGVWFRRKQQRNMAVFKSINHSERSHLVSMNPTGASKTETDNPRAPRRSNSLKTNFSTFEHGPHSSSGRDLTDSGHASTESLENIHKSKDRLNDASPKPENGGFMGLRITPATKRI